MKKILLLVAIAVSANFATAQDEGKDIKNVRFGLKVTPSLDWFKPDGKILAGNGVAPKIGGGLIIEFRLAKVASIQTGAQLDVVGGKIRYNNDGYLTPGGNTVSYYYSNSDDKILEWSASPDANTDSTSAFNFHQGNPHYQLNDRQYSITYITIPLTLKLKTKEIGMMTYYGQIGVNSSFRWKAKATDNVVSLDNTANPTISKVDITKDISFIHETLNVGLGTEMRISGSTALTFGLNYLLGFTNTVKKESDYLLKRTNNPTGSGYELTGMPQSIKSNSVVLTIGVLF
jgi:hypothetical protein